MNSETILFLSALAPDGELTFQTFADGGNGDRRLTRVLHGPYLKNAATLSELNNSGAGCFLQVNRGNMAGRKASDICAVRALFLDLDHSPLGPVQAAPIQPAIVCESSPERFHVYWPVDGIPLAAFKPAQQALAARYGGDRAVCDLSRVMRLPGFMHMKGAPFRSRLLHCDPVKPWNWPDFALAMDLPDSDSPRGAERIDKGTRNDYLFRFACGLRQQGKTMSDGLHRVTVANQSRCNPPLDSEEVERIVRSAWTYEPTGFVKLDHHLIDDPRYRRLSGDAKQTLTALMRQHNGRNNGTLTFTCMDAEDWGVSKRRRREALGELQAVGFIEYTRKGTPGSTGHRAKPDFFLLTFIGE